MKKPQHIPVGKYTAANRYALQLYRAACAVLDLPFEDRKQAINKHDQPELLAAEVIRLHKLRQSGE